MAAESSGTRKETGFDVASVALLALAVLFLMYALYLFMTGGFLSAQQVDHARKLDLPGDPQLEAHDAMQLDLLTAQPAWLDREAGKVSLPIEAAKERLVEKHGKEAGHE